jgi:Hypoxia induced protein conserved region
MPSVSGSIVGVATLLVLVALVAGLVNMMRGGSPSRSQMLMRWRVGLQFVAIIIVLIVVWLKRG